MKSLLSITLFLAVGLAPAAEPNRLTAPPTNRDYNDFRVIAQRNIFDPSRNGRRRDSGPPPPREESQTPARVESFSLLGTMSYNNAQWAFFNSADSDYRKSVSLQQSIAGYTVTAIGPNFVKLKSDTNEFTLPVGYQMVRRAKESWQLGGLADTRSESASSSSPTSGSFTSSTSSTTATAAPSTEGQSEILKRLLQKRQEEMNREN